MCADFTRAEKLLALNNPMMNLCVNGAFVIIIFLGSKLIITSQGELFDVGQLSSTFTYGFQILMSLMQLSMIFVMVTMAEESANRIVEVLHAQPTIDNPSQAVHEVADGSIDFDHVSFKYSKHAERQALDDIDLHIKSGETIGIIGGTGSAKSSLVNLIARLYDVTEGAVRVGGVDVRDYDLDALRHQVAMRSKRTCCSAAPSPTTCAGEMPTPPTRRSARPPTSPAPTSSSTGSPGVRHLDPARRFQRLRRSEAAPVHRACPAAPTKILIDDSTSAVDTKTDAKIRAGLAAYLPETTKLIIAQRIASVQDADRIIVMEGGRIANIGTHDELMECSDIYRETFLSQNRMSEEAEAAESEAEAEQDLDQAAAPEMRAAEELNAEETSAGEPNDTTQEGGEAHE